MLQEVTENLRQESKEGKNCAQKTTSSLYTMVDLFAGCGGLSMGFENAQFTPVFVNELNQDAIATYLKNRHHELGGEKFAENADLRCNDANELQGARLERLVTDLSSLKEADFRFDTVNAESGGGSTLDVLAGGPPCQGYSGIGIRRSYAVDRKEIPSNVLYGRMAQIIRRLRPRIFLFENVRGLLNAKWTREGGEPIWPDVKAEFRKIPGYEVRWSLVYAKDYGVPQNRPRVLLVGIRKDILDACPSIDPEADHEDAVGQSFNLVGDRMLTARDYFDAIHNQMGARITVKSGNLVGFYLGAGVKYGLKRYVLRRKGLSFPSLSDWKSRAHFSPFDNTQSKAKLGWTPQTDRAKFIHALSNLDSFSNQEACNF